MPQVLQAFGDKWVEAVKKEIQQFRDQDVVSPIDVKAMTKEQMNWILLYFMLLKEKWDGSIKSRVVCVDGRKKKLCIQKENRHSPIRFQTKH